MSAEEKANLDKSVDKFLESDENFLFVNAPKKIQYCLEILKRKLKSKDPEERNQIICSNSSEYYKNLIFQRDKEICILFIF